MARRPVFIPELEKNDNFVKTHLIEFQWVKGMSFIQRQKCMDSLHKSIKEKFKEIKILEVSTKSKEELGVALSAFNLMIENPRNGKRFSVECAFQAGKIFEKGGPFREILNMTSKEAKKFFKDKDLGKIIAFQSNGFKWPIYPTSMFYDWIYINAIHRQPDLADRVIDYSAFTDIEFNPNKSKNCQAYAVALYVSLRKRGLLEKVLESQSAFINFIASSKICNAEEDQLSRPSLFGNKWPEQSAAPDRHSAALHSGR